MRLRADDDPDESYHLSAVTDKAGAGVAISSLV